MKKPKAKKKDDDAVSSKSNAKSQKSRNSVKTSGSKASKSTPTPDEEINSIEKEYEPIELSVMQMLLLNITMPCCRSKYQKALKKLLKKLDGKIHRELDLAVHLRKLRDTHNYTRSFATSKVFDPTSLILDYKN